MDLFTEVNVSLSGCSPAGSNLSEHVFEFTLSPSFLADWMEPSLRMKTHLLLPHQVSSFYLDGEVFCLSASRSKKQVEKVVVCKLPSTTYSSYPVFSSDLNPRSSQDVRLHSIIIS